MGMLKYTLTLICLMAMITGTKAQTVADALRYSQTDLIGSARSMGVGNSMSALGADFSAISTNPASLGAFRGSQFVITPFFYNHRVDARLAESGGTSLSNSEGNIAIANGGIVMHARPRGSKLRTSNFAIGVNRIGSYNQSFAFSGRSVGSITDRFLELSGGMIPDNLNGFEEGLAFETGAIFDFDDDLIYNSDFDNAPGIPVMKRQSVNQFGSNTELTFAYGANLDEKLLFGVSLNVPIVNFEEDKIYREEDGFGIEDEIPVFDQLRYNEFLRTTGFGFNAKFGFNYKVDQSVSFGAAFHTPTLYTLSDNFFSSMEYTFTESESNTFESASPDGSFDYNLRTPWKAIGNIGIIINKSGFISGEIEWTDYSNAQFDFDTRVNGNQFQEIEQEINQSIDNQLGSAIRIRVGGELAINKFRLRGGFGLIQSPFINDSSFDQSYHAGFGFHEKVFYLDFGYQLFDLEEGYAPYLTADAPQPFVVKENQQSRLLMTLGLKF